MWVRIVVQRFIVIFFTLKISTSIGQPFDDCCTVLHEFFTQCSMGKKCVAYIKTRNTCEGLHWHKVQPYQMISYQCEMLLKIMLIYGLILNAILGKVVQNRDAMLNLLAIVITKWYDLSANFFCVWLNLLPIYVHIYPELWHLKINLRSNTV